MKIHKIRMVGIAHRRPNWMALGGLLAWLVLAGSPTADADILWQRPQETLVRDNGKGEDILHGAVKPSDDTSSGTLYFKFRVDPRSDTVSKVQTRQFYLAGFAFYQKGVERLGIGNAWDAWGYSAFCPTFKFPQNKPGEFVLNTDKPEVGAQTPYQAPRRGIRKTLLVKVDYVAGSDDLVTVWLDPNLSPGATELRQSDKIITRFKVDASFDQIRLIHRGIGQGWAFDEIAVATAFIDFVPIPLWRRMWFLATTAAAVVGLMVALGVAVERARVRKQLRIVERQQAVTAERVRIAQDLHDDLGARLTELVLLGELAKGNKALSGDDQNPVHAILGGLRQLHASLDEAVWSINPRNDSLAHLGDFVSDFAHRFVQHAPVDFCLEMNGSLPNIGLSATKRHNLLLAVKEALNNAVRHAAARTIRLRIGIENDCLTISVADDGIGIPADVVSTGDGLRNMHNRLETIGGNTEIHSQQGEGTLVTFRLPLKRNKGGARTPGVIRN